jgi:hypothetical protein
MESWSGGVMECFNTPLLHHSTILYDLLIVTSCSSSLA